MRKILEILARVCNYRCTNCVYGIDPLTGKKCGVCNGTGEVF